jgi:hypothetical protein
MVATANTDVYLGRAWPKLPKEPWDKGCGRLRELTLYEALIVTRRYARNNITEEIWAEIFDLAQSTLSRLHHLAHATDPSDL